MRILPFRKPLCASEQVRLNDWTQQEMADFYRAHRLLVENGVGIGMDRGISDAGDPWMAFYDVATQDVFMHVARINDACVLICDQFEIRITASNISQLIGSFEAEVHRIISLRQQKSSNVVVHPAARIILSISAIFLLFKLENNAAHAKEAPVETESTALRKQETAANARAQSLLGRLYEMIDTPVAVAALAGLLLSIELAGSSSRPASPSGESSQLSVLEINHDLALHEIQLTAGDHGENILIVSPLEGEAIEVMADPITLSVVIPVETDESSTTSGDNLPPSPIQTARPLTSFDSLAFNTVIVDGRMAPVIQEKKSAASAGGEEAAKQAVKIVESIIANLEVPADAAKMLITSLEKGIGEVSVSKLNQLNDLVALFLETEVSGSLLTDALVHFLTHFAEYEVEHAGAQVLIEQKHVSGLSEDMVGIWKNTLEDGSVISVIGHIDLIDDVASMFG